MWTHRPAQKVGDVKRPREKTAKEKDLAEILPSESSITNFGLVASITTKQKISVV